MEKKIVRIPSIRGHYCILTIRDELSKVEGVSDVKVDVTTKQTRIRWQEPAHWEKIEKVLNDIGYPPGQ